MILDSKHIVPLNFGNARRNVRSGADPSSLRARGAESGSIGFLIQSTSFSLTFETLGAAFAAYLTHLHCGRGVQRFYRKAERCVLDLDFNKKGLGVSSELAESAANAASYVSKIERNYVPWIGIPIESETENWLPLRAGGIRRRLIGFRSFFGIVESGLFNDRRIIIVVATL